MSPARQDIVDQDERPILIRQRPGDTKPFVKLLWIATATA